MSVLMQASIHGSLRPVLLVKLDESLIARDSQGKDVFELSDYSHEDEFNTFISQIQNYADGFHGTKQDKEIFRSTVLSMYP